MRNKAKDFIVELITKQMNVTGSENVLRFKDKHDIENILLLDCGMMQELNINTFSKENTDFQFDIKNVRAVFITHAHNDHIGKLPFLIKAGYDGKVYMSKETALFLENVLLDNLKIHREEAKKMNKKPLYDEGDIQKVIDLLEPLDYKKLYKISYNGVNVEFTLYRNNHILGASSIWLKIGRRFEKISLFFSGDYNTSNELLQKDVHVPKKALNDKNINVIIESTYGATKKSDERNFMDIYSAIIRGVVHENKRILIPVNALHKTQEVLHVIKNIKERLGGYEFYKKYSKEFPRVYIDGKLAIKHTYAYGGVLKRNFKPSGLIEIYDAGARNEAILDENSIILATAGMMSNGPVVQYMKKLLADQNTKIIIVSYCAEGTVGRKILEKAEYIKNARKAGKKESEIDKEMYLFGKEIIVNADVENVTSLSTHARQEELLDFIKNFNRKNISSILLNHGEKIVREKFKKIIEEELDINEEKIHLFDKRNRFIFSKHGLEKIVPIQEKNKKNREKLEKCSGKEEKVIKRKYNI